MTQRVLHLAVVEIPATIPIDRRERKPDCLWHFSSWICESARLPVDCKCTRCFQFSGHRGGMQAPPCVHLGSLYLTLLLQELLVLLLPMKASEAWRFWLSHRLCRPARRRTQRS